MTLHSIIMMGTVEPSASRRGRHSLFTQIYTIHEILKMFMPEGAPQVIVDHH